MTAQRMIKRKLARNPPAKRLVLQDLLQSALSSFKCNGAGILALALPFALATVWLEQSILSRHPVAKQDARMFAVLSIYGTCVIGYLADATISIFVFRTLESSLGTHLKSVQFRWQNLISIFIIACLAPLGTIAGLAVAIFPGVILWLSWLFAAPAAAVSGKGPFEAFRHSARLSWGSRRTLFYAFALTYICAELLTSAIVVAMGQPAFTIFQDPKPLSRWEMVLTTLIDTVQIGFCGVLCSIAYAKLLETKPNE
jgi:hypothetical protein